MTDVDRLLSADPSAICPHFITKERVTFGSPRQRYSHLTTNDNIVTFHSTSKTLSLIDTISIDHSFDVRGRRLILRTELVTTQMFREFWLQVRTQTSCFVTDYMIIRTRNYKVGGG